MSITAIAVFIYSISLFGLGVICGVAMALNAPIIAEEPMIATGPTLVVDNTTPKDAA